MNSMIKKEKSSTDVGLFLSLQEQFHEIKQKDEEKNGGAKTAGKIAMAYKERLSFIQVDLPCHNFSLPPIRLFQNIAALVNDGGNAAVSTTGNVPACLYRP